MKTNSPSALQAANWKRASTLRAIKGAIGVLGLINSRHLANSKINYKIYQIKKLLDELSLLITENYYQEKASILASKILKGSKASKDSD